PIATNLRLGFPRGGVADCPAAIGRAHLDPAPGTGAHADRAGSSHIEAVVHRTVTIIIPAVADLRAGGAGSTLLGDAAHASNHSPSASSYPARHGPQVFVPCSTPFRSPVATDLRPRFPRSGIANRPAAIGRAHLGPIPSTGA